MTLREMTLVMQHSVHDLVPRLVTGEPSWGRVGILARSILVILYWTGTASLLVLACRGPWHNRRGTSLRWMLAIFVITLPMLYFTSSYSRNALNSSGLDATGRYVVMMHTAMPIGLASLLTAGMRWRGQLPQWIAAGAFALVVGLNLSGAFFLNPFKAFDSPYYDRLPPDLTPIIDYLDEQEISRVWTDLGIAQVLMFETNERIMAADYYDAHIAGGLVRFPDALLAVESADRTAFIVPVAADQVDRPFKHVLDATGVDYTHARIMPTIEIYIPSETVDPACLVDGMR